MVLRGEPVSVAFELRVEDEASDPAPSVSSTRTHFTVQVGQQIQSCVDCVSALRVQAHYYWMSRRRRRAIIGDGRRSVFEIRCPTWSIWREYMLTAWFWCCGRARESLNGFSGFPVCERVTSSQPAAPFPNSSFPSIYRISSTLAIGPTTSSKAAPLLLFATAPHLPRAKRSLKLKQTLAGPE